MKLTKIIAFLLFAVSCQGQIDQNDPNFRIAKKTATTFLQSLFGKSLFDQNVIFDYSNSRKLSHLIYSKKRNEPGSFGKMPFYEVLFFIILKGDTIEGNAIYIDSTGHFVNEDFSPLNFTTPELLIGYKLAMNDEFPVTYKKAMDIGKQHGFTNKPYLETHTRKEYIKSKNSFFIRVQYMWSFWETMTDRGGHAILKIDSKSGTVVEERYEPPMPK